MLCKVLGKPVRLKKYPGGIRAAERILDQPDQEAPTAQRKPEAKTGLLLRVLSRDHYTIQGPAAAGLSGEGLWKCRDALAGSQEVPRNWSVARK